ncbi:MAG: hybrid sensor histidine kinase/response regulator [Alphaproteobacteria bacterium CG_4_9_14_3_um_filter_47_13]|nr:MAG: hybrid sensor histidine kinase/response regulator [Alphaproteobacteria bacterium CG_4_9_14_3_um_filter_47_13]
MDDLMAEFLTETSENLGELDLGMVNLEQNPNDKNLLSQIFRVIHTIKGTCGFIGLSRLESVAHKAEDVLGLFRDGALEVTPEYVTLIFESLDRIKFIVSELETNGKEPEGDDTELIAKLAAILANAGADQGYTAEASAILDEMDTIVDQEMAEICTETNTGTEDTEDDIALEASEAPAPEQTKTKPNDNQAQNEATKESAVANQSLRVSVDVLENLMTMVSELVLTRNQLLQILRTQGENEFTTPLQRLNHVVSDLQEGVMKTRMQPVGNAWSKLPRIIRDINIELGKKIELEMRGQDTELDRQVLELIKDPLTHMVRNSADHGIETPAERKAAGKPETGKIYLNSFHEGGHIIIEIRDDGKGLSLERIKQKALANGLATAEELARLNQQQIQQFIFRAGFSTAEKVTSVSGRGVGMDVVRTNIEKIGGSIELKSTEGKGTSVSIKIPLTLAIVSALIVESAGEKFAIPQLTVKELVMTSSDGESRIETIKGTPVFRLRDHLLPLVSLQKLLKISLGDQEIETSAEGKSREIEEARYANKYIVVTQVGAYTFGVIVDKVFDTEEIVIKPVANILRNIEIFSGNTILGDGTVIMILDPMGIAKCSGEINLADSRETDEESSTQKRVAEKISLLLFSAGSNAPKAVPLELVSRLEEIRTTEIEKANGKYVVQYRGKLMPLIPFDASMDIMGQEKKPVLVFSDHHNAMGLIVDKIIDITEQHIDIQIKGIEETLMGSAIIEGKATDVINVGHFLHSVDPHWFKDHGDEPFTPNGRANGDGQAKRVLLVEDSPFFRNMLTPLLQMAGYEVTATENPLEALKLHEAGYNFDVIISDIEMPEMSGFEFAENVKTRENWQDVPMVALSSHATPQDIHRGMEAGFTKYIAKFDRDTLLNTISETIAERYGDAI